jgi:hypothetical protein
MELSSKPIVLVLFAIVTHNWCAGRTLPALSQEIAKHCFALMQDKSYAHVVIKRESLACFCLGTRRDHSVERATAYESHISPPIKNPDVKAMLLLLLFWLLHYKYLGYFDR